MNAKGNEKQSAADLAVSRRAFLKSSGGLVVAFSLLGPAASADTAQESLAPPAAGKLYAWLAVHPDNTATLFTGKVETGTGVQTALAQIAAEELDFPVDRLDVLMGTTSKTVDQGPTYGSMTVRYAGPQIRHAAAAGGRPCSTSPSNISAFRPTSLSPERARSLCCDLRVALPPMANWWTESASTSISARAANASP